ncbi:MAG: CoA-binding protein [Bacteroidetes bacterium]|nr:MAG: CoA-binding protein [Bacteroidota bacterium]
MKKTVILGASNNPERYAFRAASLLKQAGHEFIPVGVKRGDVFGRPIQSSLPGKSEEIDTLTLYINPSIQESYYDAILAMEPKRIIFNPGTENNTLRQKAEAAGIETEYACTLVMIGTGQY